MRRTALLFAGATLWLLLAAVPVLADGGVHVAATNSGFSTLTADGCAGCHRAHTAQGEYLLRAASANGLCLTCHGSSSTGATADVMTGVQYKLTSGIRDTGTQIGALRNGGFDQARIDSANPSRWTYLRTATDTSTRPKVGVSGAPANVTSSHLDLDGAGGVVAKDVAWGNGAVNTGAGPVVEIECVSCHNPHGNGQYRILNTLPTAPGIVDPVTIPIASVSSTTDRFTTTYAHGLVVGDIVTISGVTGAAPSFSTGAQYVVKSVPNGVTFSVAAAPTKTSVDIVSPTIDITSSGTGGTVARFTANVDDAPLPASGDERNYTVIQVRGYQGSPDSYLLYASDVLSARSASDYDFVADIVGLTASDNRFTTGLPHGFALGDTVTIAGGTPFDGAHTIATIPNSTTFTLTGVDVLVNSTAVGTGTISAVDAGTDTITLSAAHSFAVNDPVLFINGPAPLVPGTVYYVITSATPDLQVSATLGGSAVDLTGTTTGGQVYPAGENRVGTATKTVAGAFGATAGDYFHRTVPWDPKAINPACTYDVFTNTSNGNNPDYASACLTANDAPNGRPATVVNTGGSGDPQRAVNGVLITPSAYGQVAFNDQISAWCSACHSRYYSGTNPNPGGEPGSSTETVRTISAIDLGTNTITTTANHGFAVGDIVDFSATPTAPDLSAGSWFVVYSSGATFRVSATYDGSPVDITAYNGGGTVVRIAPAAASSWWFPRPGEPIYKFQHQTTTNRACVTCHVSHGSNAAMPGVESGGATYPDGSSPTVGSNSRLLKVDNRGTCQMCHDPTGTSLPGDLLPLSLGGTPPTVP